MSPTRVRNRDLGVRTPLMEVDNLTRLNGYEFAQDWGPEFRHWLAKVAAAQNGTDTARLMIVSDSVFAQGTWTRATEFQYLLRNLLQSGVRRIGGEGFVPVTRTPIVSPAWYDWTLVGGDTTEYGFGPGKRAFTLNSSSASATKTFMGDRFRLFWDGGATTGKMQVTVDGGAPIVWDTRNINQGGRGSNRGGAIWDSVTDGGLTLKRGLHTIVVQANNATYGVYNAVLDGGYFYDGDFDAGIHFIDAAVPGTTTAHWGDRSQFAGYGWAAGLDNIRPDLVVIELGLNDQATAFSIPQMQGYLAGIKQNVLDCGGWGALSYTPSFVIVPIWNRGDGASGTTGAITNGSTTFTDASASFALGLATGPGAILSIPSLGFTTRIVGKQSGTALTMAAPAPSTNSGLTYTITYDEEQWRYYATGLRDFARANGMAIWDMYAVLGSATFESLSTDKLHPNQLGNRVLANKMAEDFTGIVNLDSYTTLILGDGVDGAIIFDGTTTITLAGGATIVPSANVYTLPRDIYATSITINSGVTVKPAGNRMLAIGTFTNNGTISVDGAAASGSTGGAAGATATISAGAAGGSGGTGVGGAGSTGGSLRLGGPGGGGGGSGTAGGTAGGAGSAADGWNSKTGGTAGTAGTAGNAGGAGGATTITTARGNIHEAAKAILAMTFDGTNAVITTVAGGAGGGAGGGTAASGQGAGAGAGGGIIVIGAAMIINAGTISAVGGAGVGTANAGGGGGGGGGGVVILVGRNVVPGTINVSGGAGGTATSTGKSGAAGGAGTILIVPL